MQRGTDGCRGQRTEQRRELNSLIRGEGASTAAGKVQLFDSGPTDEIAVHGGEEYE